MVSTIYDLFILYVQVSSWYRSAAADEHYVYFYILMIYMSYFLIVKEIDKLCIIYCMCLSGCMKFGDVLVEVSCNICVISVIFEKKINDLISNVNCDHLVLFIQYIVYTVYFLYFQRLYITALCHYCSKCVCVTLLLRIFCRAATQNYNTDFKTF